MSTDIIELGSSDDEREPVPKKIKIMPNAMVRIPSHTKIPGVTIKPTKNKKNVPYGAINNVVTITNNPQHTNNSLLKPTLKKLSVASGSLPNRINAVSPKATGSKLLKKLPASITVKKATASKFVRIPIEKPKLVKTPVGQVVQRHHIHDDLKLKPLPQWYKTPEDLESEKRMQEKQRKNKNMISMEEKNNTEPTKLIEITIDDSPVKVSAAKEIPIMIDDSPVKIASNINDDLNKEKEKQSKKMLNYENIKIVKDSMGMIEVEVDAIDVDQLRNDPCGTQSTKISHDDELQKDVQDVPLDKSSTKNIKENLDSEKTSTINKTDIVYGKNDVISTQVCDKEKVKESASTDEEFNSIYQKFIDTCFRIENSNEMQYIVEKKIKSYYRQCPKEYVDSEEFLDLVSGKITAIEASPNKMYLYIRDVVNELNIQRKMVKAGTSTKNEKSESPGNNINTSECDTKHWRQIKKLEKTLTKLHRAIQKLEEQEIDFDEEDDSIYLLTERYKERFLRVHAKFCQLTQTKMPSEPYIKLESLPGRPKGPAARLEKWINKKLPIGKPLPFPDFHDVLRCVREANTEDKLGWSEMEILEEARELFTSCGKILKRRRQENEWRIASSRLPVNEDPAENDIELKKKLDQNKMVAKRNETDILNKYVDRQNQLKLEPEVIGDKEAEESPIESDEDDDNESDVIQIVEEKKVEKEETNIETYTESNKDDSNLLQKLYSESDSDSPINLTDSENELSSPKMITSDDVISIEDSSYSESENCTNRPDESNTGPVQMDIELSDDSIIGHAQSNNKEYLTVDITKDIQEILSSKNEIREKTSAEGLEIPINNVDESNDDIEIVNDKPNLGTEITDGNVEIINVDVLMTDNTIGKKNTHETKMMVRNTHVELNKAEVEINDKQIQESEKSTEPESSTRQVDDELNKAIVTNTNQHIDKDKCNIEINKTDIDVEMEAGDVATTDKFINVDNKNFEVGMTKEHIDVEMNDADIEPIDKHNKENKSTAIEIIKKNDIKMNNAKFIKANNSNLEIEISTHTDIYKSVSILSNMTTDKQIKDKNNIEIKMTIEHTDVEKNDTDIKKISNRDNERNVKSTDKSIEADKDNISIEKCNGDAEMANVQSDEPVNKVEMEITKTIVDVEIIKNETEHIHVGSNAETKMMQINNIESEIIDNHTDNATNKADNIVSIDENSTVMSEICTKIIENIETVTNTCDKNHSREIVVNNVIDESKLCIINAKDSPLNTERKHSNNFNEMETIIDKLAPGSDDSCGNLENNILSIKTCSKPETSISRSEIDITTDKKT